MGRRLDTWLYGRTATMSVTYTQANVAGGAVVCEITPGSGCEFIFLSARGVNSGTNGLSVVLENAAAAGAPNQLLLASVASGAATTMNISVGSVSTAGVTTTASPAGLSFPCTLTGVETLKLAQTAAGAQNDTVSWYVRARLKGGTPTVIHSNSSNPGNVSVTAGAESFATV